MSTSDAVPSPRWRWLDRWLEPRWRALLTWVVLAALTEAVTYRIDWQWVFQIFDEGQDWFLTRLPIALPAIAKTIGWVAATSLFSLWFPPIILRLGLARTLVWIGLGTASQYVFGLGVMMPPMTFATRRGCEGRGKHRRWRALQRIRIRR